jgi:RND family efflux transporter MFP subunit
LREPQLGLARANLDAARAALAKAELDLDRTVLRPPFDGRTLSASVDVGQFVGMGQVVGRIHGIETAEIPVPVPDEDLAWIDAPTPRVNADGTLAWEGEGSPVEVVARFAGSLHRWTGRVARTEAAVDERSRMVTLVVEVDDPYRSDGRRPPLAVGMFVEVRIHGRELPGAVAIPRSALRGRDEVWVARPDSTLEVRAVDVARAEVGRVIVGDGLAPGEWIVTSSLEAPTTGMRVRPRMQEEAAR